MHIIYIKMKRLTKEQWFKEGMKVLEAHGSAGLTIDELTKRLNVTKGSFYHHFKNRITFSEELLGYWEQQMTLGIINASRRVVDFDERNKKIMDLSNKPSTYKREVAIRAWALRDPVARAFQKRIDKQRLSFLTDLYDMFTKEKEQAELMAHIRYCFVIGAQQIIPSIKGKKLQFLLSELNHFFEQSK